MLRYTLAIEKYTSSKSVLKCNNKIIFILDFLNIIKKMISGLMNAADYYGLDELRKSCSGFVQCCINVDTVCALLASAERYIQYKCTKSMVQKVRHRCFL